jgi:hypothetical protein
MLHKSLPLVYVCLCACVCVCVPFIAVKSWSWSSSCGRQSVDQFVLVSGLPLGPMTRFYLSLLFSFDNYFVVLPRAPSLRRGRVCSLQCNRWLVRSLKTNNHTLLSHLRLCSLFVASYDSQGLRWKYSNPPPHGVSLLGKGSVYFIFLSLQGNDTFPRQSMHVTIEYLMGSLFSMRFVLHQRRICDCLCILQSLLYNTSRQRKMFGSDVFSSIRVVSKNGRPLVVPITFRFI